MAHAIVGATYRKANLILCVLVACLGCLFFVSHGYSEHVVFLKNSEIAILVAQLCFIFSIIFFILKWIMQNALSAAFVTLFISCWYLFYGSIHSSLKELLGDSFFSSHKFIVIASVLTTIILIIVLRKVKISNKTIKFILTLASVFFIIDAIATIRLLASKKEKGNEKIVLTGAPKSNANIYLIVYDEYPGIQSQLDSFGYDNQLLKQYFATSDFKCIQSRSNYNLTHFSMASIFNMEYQPYCRNNEYVVQQDFDKALYAVQHNLICRYLHRHQFVINNYSIFDIDGYPKAKEYSQFINQNNLLLTHKILHNKIYHDEYWNVYSWWPEWVVKDWKQAFLKEKNTFDNFAIEANSKQFSYYHFNIPHEPIMVDSSGRLYGNDTLLSEFHLNRNMFLQYTKYTTTQLIQHCKTIVQADATAIVIVISDHGYKYYFNNEETPCENRFNTIMAIRAPNYTIPDSMSNINCFRWLLNEHFNEHLHYLPDTTVFLKLK